MPLSRLKEFLDAHRVKYISISHSLAYTAQGVAALAHIPGKDLAKTVVVKLDGRLVMAVVPANHHVDTQLLKKASSCKVIEVASESEFADRFPDCEAGAMPPFGNLYDMDVFVDERLSNDKQIAFNAGSHRELIQMAWHDYELLVKPRIVRLTRNVAEVSAA
jgi:Ala-tRNA(Pro) deacylase